MEEQPIQEKTKESGLGENLRRGDAFAYLHALLTKSILFQKEIDVIRQLLHLKVLKRPSIEVFTAKSTPETDQSIKHYLKQRATIDERAQELTTEETFIALCDKFYLPPYFYKQVASIILGLSFNRAFNYSISVRHSTYHGSKDTYTFNYNETSLVPPAFITLPINFLKGDLNDIKKVLEESQLDDFFEDVHEWKYGTSFDRAYLAYSLNANEITGKERLEIMFKELEISPRNSEEYFKKKMHTAVKIIRRQITYVKNYQKLITDNIT